MKRFVFLIIMAGGIAAAVFMKEEPKNDEEIKKDDTGYDRRETENLMREIGYVQ